MLRPSATHWQCIGLWVVLGHNQVKRAHFSLRRGLALCVCPCSVGMSQPMLRCAASVELNRSTRTARQDRSSKRQIPLPMGDSLGHVTAGWSCHLSGICLVFMFWTLLYTLMSCPFHVYVNKSHWLGFCKRCPLIFGVKGGLLLAPVGPTRGGV